MKTKKKINHSTTGLIILITIIFTGTLAGAITSTDLDKICSTNNMVLYRFNGLWGCGYINTSQMNITITYNTTNITYYQLNETDPNYYSNPRSYINETNITVITTNGAIANGYFGQTANTHPILYFQDGILINITNGTGSGDGTGGWNNGTNTATNWTTQIGGIINISFNGQNTTISFASGILEFKDGSDSFCTMSQNDDLICRNITGTNIYGTWNGSTIPVAKTTAQDTTNDAWTGTTSMTATSNVTLTGNFILANGQYGIKMNSTTFPTCNATYEGYIMYNYTLKKHIGCNSTTWNSLY